MKFALTVIAVCLASASLNQGAFAQNTVTLTQEDPQGYFWDAGNSQYGQNVLQIYQAFVPNEPSQAFTWTPAPGGFTVCSLKVCLSDDGQGHVLMSGKSDVFTITNQSAVLDVNTGKYVEQSSNPANGSQLSMGTTPVAWKFAFAGSSSSSSGGNISSGQVPIMPLGDSITEGWATAATFAQGGYRCPLASLLQNAGVSFSFLGDSAALEPGVVTNCPEVNWEGHGGYDIASIQGFADSDGSIRVLQPEIVLLLAGTNDVAQGETSAVSGQLTSLLSNIFAQDPNAWVILSTIPPMNPNASAASSSVAGWAAQVPAANAQIKTVAAQFSRTTLIDFYSAAVGNVGANIGSDGIHPTVTGYGILASLWSNAITAHLAGK
ncbi:MAG TPA: GDSL-type esterase/lipase family protein [Acidobacteriaceae bacterium]|nr:GDSL-type esterase/lipase family protein [Acidobacteriaceae bacterium]